MGRVNGATDSDFGFVPCRLKFTALCICRAPFTFSSTYNYDTTGQKYEGGSYYYYSAVAPACWGFGFD